MKKSCYIVAVSVVSLLMSCGNQDNESLYGGTRIRTVQASLKDHSTRVALTEDAHTHDMITQWQKDDRIHVMLVNNTDYTDIGSVPIYDISENGKSCNFKYALPDDFDASKGYGLSCYTHNCKPVIVDGDILYNASLERMPIKEFKARVMFDQYVNEENCFGSFEHYGTYELLHVANNSDESIEFSLCGFEADNIWFKSTGGIRLFDGKFITDTRFERIEESPTVTIPAHGSDTIVSWYIPNGQTIQKARLVAKIDGEYVHSSNTKSSDVTLCTGIAYHMFAAWDGEKLQFTNRANEIEDEDYNKSICSEFFPADGAIQSNTNLSVSCQVTFPWSGEMIMEFRISEDPQMSSIIKGIRSSLMGSAGSVHYCSADFDLENNKTYYWQVSYFDMDEMNFLTCSPIMSFTIKNE